MFINSILYSQDTDDGGVADFKTQFESYDYDLNTDRFEKSEIVRKFLVSIGMNSDDVLAHYSSAIYLGRKLSELGWNKENPFVQFILTYRKINGDYKVYDDFEWFRLIVVAYEEKLVDEVELELKSEDGRKPIAILVNKYLYQESNASSTFFDVFEYYLHSWRCYCGRYDDFDMNKEVKNIFAKYMVINDNLELGSDISGAEFDKELEVFCNKYDISGSDESYKMILGTMYTSSMHSALIKCTKLDCDNGKEKLEQLNAIKAQFLASIKGINPLLDPIVSFDDFKRNDDELFQSAGPSEDLLSAFGLD